MRIGRVAASAAGCRAGAATPRGAGANGAKGGQPHFCPVHAPHHLRSRDVGVGGVCACVCLCVGVARPAAAALLAPIQRTRAVVECA